MEWDNLRYIHLMLEISFSENFYLSKFPNTVDLFNEESIENILIEMNKIKLNNSSEPKAIASRIISDFSPNSMFLASYVHREN